MPSSLGGSWSYCFWLRPKSTRDGLSLPQRASCRNNSLGRRLYVLRMGGVFGAQILHFLQPIVIASGWRCCFDVRLPDEIRRASKLWSGFRSKLAILLAGSRDVHPYERRRGVTVLLPCVSAGTLSEVQLPPPASASLRLRPTATIGRLCGTSSLRRLPAGGS